MSLNGQRVTASFALQLCDVRERRPGNTSPVRLVVKEGIAHRIVCR